MPLKLQAILLRRVVVITMFPTNSGITSKKPENLIRPSIDKILSNYWIKNYLFKKRIKNNRNYPQIFTSLYTGVISCQAKFRKNYVKPVKILKKFDEKR